jgi:hypothetical protein
LSFSVTGTGEHFQGNCTREGELASQGLSFFIKMLLANAGRLNHSFTFLKPLKPVADLSVLSLLCGTDYSVLGTYWGSLRINGTSFHMDAFGRGPS